MNINPNIKLGIIFLEPTKIRLTLYKFDGSSSTLTPKISGDFVYKTNDDQILIGDARFKIFNKIYNLLIKDNNLDLADTKIVPVTDYFTTTFGDDYIINNIQLVETLPVEVEQSAPPPVEVQQSVTPPVEVQQSVTPPVEVQQSVTPPVNVKPPATLQTETLGGPLVDAPLSLPTVPPETNITNNFNVGDKVFAKYKGKNKWYPGIIAKANVDGTYDIDYNNGEKEQNVNSEKIRPINVGDKVFANYKENNKWYPGIIAEANDDGTYDIKYNDGVTEQNVNSVNIFSK